MTTATEPSLQELSPQIQKLIARHQAYEAVSSQWNYLSYKPNPEDNPHWAQCRATDLEWNYDIDRYSRNLWTHQKSERYRTSSTIGGRANDSRSPTRNWGSPTKPSPRRTRSTSIGERINLSSPLKKNPDNSTRKQIDAPCNSYRTPRGNKEKLITPKSEKKVLDDLYEIYQSSKNDGGNSSRQAEKITKASPHQTPERIMFASPSGASERRKMNKNPVKWEDEEQAQLTKTLDIKYYDGNEGVYNDSASQLSQNTNRGELKEDSSQDSQAQSMKRRSRDERKKLKEEKMKSTAIAMGEFGGVQESQEHLIRKVLGEDSVGELSSVASKSEKNKERRLRKDRTKKNETDKDDNNQESEELASQFRTIEYNRSHEIETRKDRSMIRSLPNETLGGQNREKLVNLDMQDNSQKKSNTQKVSKLTKDLDQNEEGIFNQERDVSGQSSEKLLENSGLEAQKKRSSVKASGISPDRNLINPDSEEFVADTHKNSNIIPGRNTENEEEKNEASLDGYQDNGEIEKESIDIHVWSAKKEMSFEEYLKSHRKEEAIRSPTVYSQREDTENDISASGQEYYKTESDPDLSTKKDFLSPNRGQGFLGLRLPIDESRSFIDTDKDWGSSAAKEDGKEGCDSNFQKAIQGSSQFVFDPSQQTASVRPGESELSQEEFVSSNKCAEKEEQSKGQSFKRKMRLEYKREDSSQEANDWQEDDQELKNFLEIENHVLKNEEKGKVKSKSKPQAFESLQVEVQEYENNNSEDGSLDHGMERVIVNLMNKFNDQEDMDRERKSLESNGKSWNGEEGHNVSPALFEKIMRSKQEDDQRLVGSHNTPAIKKDKNREFEEILLEILPVAESIKLEQTKKKANQSKAYSLENKAEQSELNKKDIYQKEREKTMQLDRKRVSKETIFDTEITWEKLQLFRKVEQNAATKIQDFCVQKSKKIERVEEKNINGHNDSKKEFQALIETMKNHENLYKQMKGLVGDKGDDVINLSLAFISAYCSLKTGKHNF